MTTAPSSPDRTDGSAPGAVPAEVRERLAAHRGVTPYEVDVVARFASKRADSGHACPGELFVDSYVDDDGFEHIVVSTWYECEHLLEIEEDLILLGGS